jgi:hypothetical protein
MGATFNRSLAGLAWRASAVAAVLCLAATAPGCKDEAEEADGDKQAAAGKKAGKEDSPRPKTFFDAVAEDVRGPEPEKETHAEKRPETGGVEVLAEEFLDFLEAKFSKDTTFMSRHQEAFEAKVRDSKQFIALMRDVYDGRRYQPVFFEYQDRVPALSQAGAEMKDLVLEAPSHGFGAKDYQTARLAELIPAFDTAVKEYAEMRGSLSGDKVRKLWKLADRFDSMPRDSEVRKLLAEQGLTDADVKLVQELARFYPNLLAAKRELNQRLQEVDIILLSDFFRFVLDFKYLYKAHPFSVTPEISLSHVKLREKLLDDFRKADPDFAQYILGLVPTNPIYTRLRNAWGFYDLLARQGKVDKYKIKKAVSRGAKGPEVKYLAERLALEGYLEDRFVSDRFGAELEAAVKDYQTMHQLRQSGKLDTETRASMNVPMATRVKQIELGLQRWRESDITRTNPAFLLRVNIPQFELEAWENNTLVRKHRVVVGNTSTEVNLEKKQRGRFNVTPLISKAMTTVVLNPFWYPPPRIQAELLKDLEKQPDFFEKNNYGVRMGPNGEEIIFQKSGGDNALGQVKFLFPNEYDVYLHDTPKKPLFERPIRAYSHGCMRLDKPVDFAYFILGKINGMSKEDVEKILTKKKDKETYIKLNAPVPIFVEYCSVSADERGKAYFFADIYKYDRAYWDGRLPVENTEDISPSELKALSGSGLPTGDADDDGVRPGQ